MKLLILFFMIQTAWAQVFVTDSSSTEMNFEGTLLTRGKSDKGIITIRESHGAQVVLIVNEVKDFKFPSQFEESEFKDEYMESQYFPQIRINGKLKEKIDLTKDGIYIVHFTGLFTMRQQSKQMEFPVRMEITGKNMTFHMARELDLSQFHVPYAGAGSEIGKYADYLFHAELKRIH